MIATLEAEASRMGAVSFLVDSQPAKGQPPQPNPKSANNPKPQPVSQPSQNHPVKAAVSNNNPSNNQGQKEEELKINVKK